MTVALPPRTDLPASLTLVGAGKMGGALLRGWIAGGLAPAAITVVDPQAGPDIVGLCSEHGIALNPATVQVASTLVLAIKPQALDEAKRSFGAFTSDGTLVLSILAGKTIADLRARMPKARAFVRTMPNLPASIGRGATGAVASPEVTAEQRRNADTLLACSGLVEWLADEAQIDALTALSGSGPAYVFLLTEALAEAGLRAGLPAAVSERLARATVAGSGALLDRTATDAGQLRRDVTSPGGTTAAALAILMREGGLPDLVTEAVAAAAKRAGELAG